MVEVRLLVEGGGERGEYVAELRRSFSELFGKLNLKGKLSVIPCGSRSKAYKVFCDTFRNSTEFQVLLIDSERALPPGASWTYLSASEKWQPPQGAEADQLCWMVECTESWLLCDVAALKEYFGPGFKAGKLPGSHLRIEEVPKQDVMDGLENASRDLVPSKRFNKRRDTHQLLRRLDPNLLEQSSPQARRLFAVLRGRLDKSS